MDQILEIHTSCADYTSIAIHKIHLQLVLNFRVTSVNTKVKGGVLKLFLSGLKSPRATDINPIAAQCTLQTAKQNGVNVCCVVTDLVSCNLSNVILMELYSK